MSHRGVASSIATTFDSPMIYGGGPASVVWCWFMGCFGCFFIATSIAELVSAFPTSGGLYSASCFLVPRRWRGPVGYVGQFHSRNGSQSRLTGRRIAVGWMQCLGNLAGAASTEFGLSRMIWAGVTVAYDGDVRASEVWCEAS